MARKGNNRRYRVIVTSKPAEMMEERPALSERYFLVFAFGVVLFSTLTRTFDFSITAPSYNGLFITRPYCGLHDWHFAHQAWDARNHVKYGLGYTRGYRTSVVGDPPPEHPQRYVSHPPLEILITAFGMLLFGTKEWEVRLFDLLLSVPALLLIMLILKKLYNSPVALVCGLLLVSFPIFAYFNFGLLIMLSGLWALYRYLILTGRQFLEDTAVMRPAVRCL